MATVFAAADREPAAYTSDISLPRDAKGMLFRVNYSAEGGATATLDVKLQYHDSVRDTYEDIPGASIAQMTAVGEIDLIVYPGIAAIANRQVSIPLPRRFRVVATVGTDNLTFSIASVHLA